MPYVKYDATVITCDLIRGRPSVLKEKVETWEVHGIDGVGAHRLGKSDAPFVFLAALFGDVVDVEAWYVSLAGAQGKICEILDDWDSQQFNMLVTEVSQLARDPALPYECRGEVRLSGVRAGSHLG